MVIDAPVQQATTETTTEQGSGTTTEGENDTENTNENTEGSTDGNADDAAGGDGDYMNAGNGDETDVDTTETETETNTEGTSTEGTETTDDTTDDATTETATDSTAGTTTDTEATTDSTTDGTTTGTSADTTGNAFSQAPFRVVDDGTSDDLASLKADLSKLTASIIDKAKNPVVLSASNKADESVIEELRKSDAKADQEVVDKITKQQAANLKIADPYEIAILHKIGEKVRVIQDAVKRQAIGEKQVLPPETLMLKNIVASVRSMRKRAEEQYQNAPRRVFAKDERRLRKMEKLLKKMTELMNDRSLSPKQFNQLSAIYRDKLNNLRREIH